MESDTQSMWMLTALSMEAARLGLWNGLCALIGPLFKYSRACIREILASGYLI